MEIKTGFFFFNGISNFAKSILLEEQELYYLTQSWEDKGVRTFTKNICLKVDVIARQEFELTKILQTIALTITPQRHPPN